MNGDPAPPPILVHDHRLVTGLWDDRGGDTLLITFNEIGFRHQIDDYWGRRVAARLGMSSLGFTSRGRNWHPEAAYHGAQTLAATMRDRYRRIVLFGFSQGAYAAIRHSALFDADAVLAFSPQASIDPAVVGGFDQRFVRYFEPSIHADMAIRTEHVTGAVYIFFDPNGRDARHVEMIAVGAASHPVRITRMGHDTIYAAASSPVLAHLLEAIDAADPVRRMTNLLRRSKKQSFPYLINLANALLRRKHFTWSAQLAERARLVKPESPALATLDAHLSKRRALAIGM